MLCIFSFLQIQPKYLYKLLCSLSEKRRDLLHIMELVKMKKPLTALDFCYQGKCLVWNIFFRIENKKIILSLLSNWSTNIIYFNVGDPENISVLECVSLCVLVVAYDSGTKRARQMLTILNAILPYFLRDLVRDKKTEPKAIRETIHQLTVTMKALINNCDELTK